MTRATVLAIDAGKTGTRAALFATGTRGTTATGPGIANVAMPGGLDQIRAVLGDVAGRALGRSRCDAVGIGLTGVLEPDHQARAVGDVLRDLVPADRIVVTSDVVTTYCGALGATPGVVVAAGTGSIVLGVGPDGKLARVDGWGYLLDDAGSAFEIGRCGLREVLRAADGRGGSPVLFDAAMAAFGSTAAMVERVYGSANPARVIAGFATEVSAAADAGDHISRGLLDDASARLADSAVAAAHRVFAPDATVPISWQGGVFSAGAAIVDPFIEHLRAALPAAEFHRPAGDALDGAAELAAAVDGTVLDALLDVRDGTAS